MKFSGVLRDATGKPISGPVEVTFALYAADAGGDPLWFETQSVQADEQGRYTSLIGVMHAEGLPIELFTSGEARWLGVEVSNEPEQKPRVLLLSVPYALKAADAETFGGLPKSAFVLSDAAQTSGGVSGATSAGTTASSLKATAGKNQPAPLVLTGTQNYIPVFTDNSGSLGNSAMYQTGGNVGMGTTAPLTKFDILFADSAAYANAVPSIGDVPVRLLNTANHVAGGVFTGMEQVAHL